MRRKMRHQYKPALAKSESPRVTVQFRLRVHRLCKRWELPEAAVLRYCFDAAVLTSGKGLKRTTSADPKPLEEMVTVRATLVVKPQFEKLLEDNRGVFKYDIVRALLEHMLIVAESRGMAHVMAVRESALAPKTRA